MSGGLVQAPATPHTHEHVAVCLQGSTNVSGLRG
jgi:hypothetical protein